MGLMSTIIAKDEKREPATREESLNAQHVKQQTTDTAPTVSPTLDSPVTTPARPCSACGSYLAWETIYGDGVLRCDQCQSPPAKAMLGKWWGLVETGSSGQEPGFAWEVIKLGSGPKGGARRSNVGDAKGEGKTVAFAGEVGDSTNIDVDSLPPLTWSAPDIDGWCWGWDVEGKLHARQRRLVANGSLAIGERWLTETEEEWQRRVATIDEFWREREAVEREAVAVATN